MIPDLLKYPYFAYDTETTGTDRESRVFGFSISTPDDKDYFFDMRDRILFTVKDLGRPSETLITLREDFDGGSWINSEFKKIHLDDVANTQVVCHNLSFDYRMSHYTGIKLPSLQRRCMDTCILACLVNEQENSYALDYLASKYTHVKKQGKRLYEEMAEIFGGRATKNVQMRRIAEAPNRIVAPYAMSDTRSTLELFEYLMGEIDSQNLTKILNFERKVTPKLIAAEMRGVRVDTKQAQLAVGQVSEEIKIAQKELDDIAGFHCNPQPSKDMKALFNPVWRDGHWWANDGTKLLETNSGAASLGADALREMKHPAAAKILELRSLLKTRDTFLVNHVLESSFNGRVYPTINQNKSDSGGTGTGRLSYTSPALQQIPDRNKKVAEVVKTIFLPEEGHSWVDADMASFEVRIFAHLVGTREIIQAYLDDPETDFHQFVADMTGLVRNATYSGQPNAKQLNLSMIFNQGDGTTADKMGLPWTWETFTPYGSTKEVTYKKAGLEARAVIDKYHKTLPGVKMLAEGCKRTAEERGWIFTRHGRHLRFPNGYKSYKASGLLIQSTSADENKQNWVTICDVLEGTGAELLLNTHDSYSMSMPIGEEERIAKMVKEAVEADRGLKVPMILEVQRPGKNWWKSKSSERWL